MVANKEKLLSELKRGFVQNHINATAEIRPILDKSITWTTVGLGVTLGLSVTNIDSLIEVFSKGTVIIMIMFLLFAVSFGVLSKYFYTQAIMGQQITISTEQYLHENSAMFDSITSEEAKNLLTDVINEMVPWHQMIEVYIARRKAKNDPLAAYKMINDHNSKQLLYAKLCLITAAATVLYITVSLAWLK